MSQARFVVEIGPKDPSGPRLLSHLHRSVKSSCIEMECVVEKKEDFQIVPTLEQGILHAVKSAGDYAEPWCIYVSPRQMQLVVNKSSCRRVNGAVVAIARNKRPAALFLLMVTVGDDLPLFIEEAVTDRFNELRAEVLSECLSEPEEEMVVRFRSAIDGAYAAAISPDRFHS